MSFGVKFADWKAETRLPFCSRTSRVSERDHSPKTDSAMLAFPILVYLNSQTMSFSLYSICITRQNFIMVTLDQK